MPFFHSLSVPEFWEWIFLFHSRSRILGMPFFHSLPVPEFWEWAFSIPFLFPNFGNGIFYSRSRSRTLKSHSRSPLTKSDQARARSSKSGWEKEPLELWPGEAAWPAGIWSQKSGEASPGRFFATQTWLDHLPPRPGSKDWFLVRCGSVWSDLR